MRTRTEKFLFEMNDSEVWACIHTLKERLMRTTQHCTMYDGWETFLRVFSTEWEMYKSFCGAIGRTELIGHFEEEYLRECNVEDN